MSLFNAIKGGEGKNVEFKEEIPSGQAIAKTVVAFANTAGGKLIIGVNNLGEVIGLKPDFDILELRYIVPSIIYDNCYPNILFGYIYYDYKCKNDISNRGIQRQSTSVLSKKPWNT